MCCHTSSRAPALLALLFLLIASAGCHQIKIDSGLEPSPTVHHEEWNMAFAWAIYPAQVDASEYCGGNWAQVETKQSFLNWVVGAVTWGIITPMDTKVVCAASGRSSGGESSEPQGEEGPSESPDPEPSIE